MDPAALRKLLSREGWALLSRLPPYSEANALAISEGLRQRGVDGDLVAAAMTQSRLRARAWSKFGDFAEGMLFTPDGLEQATRLPVAAQHAKRYAEAGCEHVADLACGIGGDAMALAGLDLRVSAYETDELTAALGTVNLRHFSHATVHHLDGLQADLDDVDAVFADPARRHRGGKRVFDPQAYAPRLDELLALREKVPALGLKVAPGIKHHDLPAEAHAQWVSVDGDVLEAGLWFACLSPEGPGRSALVIRDDAAHLLSDPEVTAANAAIRHGQARELGSYLYEPDGAVIRAGLVAQAGAEVGAGLVAPAIAYLTGDSLQASPFLTAYRVVDVFDFGLKRLRSYLRSRDVGTVTIKKRGTALEPGQLRRQLALSGTKQATIVLTRIGDRPRIIVVEPVGAA